MNSQLFEIIQNRIARQNIKFGSCDINLTFHDGRITKWCFSFCEMHNVDNQKNTHHLTKVEVLNEQH